jgi:hypothetical protein
MPIKLTIVWAKFFFSLRQQLNSIIEWDNSVLFAEIDLKESIQEVHRVWEALKCYVEIWVKKSKVLEQNLRIYSSTGTLYRQID